MMVQKQASLAERAVQKVARENISFKKSRGKATHKPSSKVRRTIWSDGVDPRVVRAIHNMKVPQVWRYVQVVSPTEVIVHNNPLR